MPFDLLHIVYLLLRFSCCFSKKTCYFFGVFPSKNQNFRPYFLRALQTRRIFSAISVPCAIFFALFEQIFLRFVRSFLSSVFRQRALCLSFSFLTCKNLLFRLFSQKKTLHNQNNSLVNARVCLMCKFFCVYFQLRQCRTDLNKAAKRCGFCTRSYFPYQFVHIVVFITPSPFSAQKACSYQRLLM